jgi:hypothetical protein
MAIADQVSGPTTGTRERAVAAGRPPHLRGESRHSYRTTDGSRDSASVTKPADSLDAFAQWFADWWIRRGLHLTDPNRSDPDSGPPTSSPSIGVRD